MRQSLFGNGFLLAMRRSGQGITAIETRAEIVVHRRVWVDRLVTEPAPPTISLPDFFQRGHGKNLIHGSVTLQAVARRCE